MTVARNNAIADIDTQIIQAQAYQGLPTMPLGKVGPETQQLPENFPTVQQPPTGLQNRQLTGDETVRLAPYVPAVAPGDLAPPPPKSSQNAKRDAEKEQRDQETLQQKLARNRLRVALAGVQLGQSTNRLLQGANRNLGSIPTPGGIWTPFWILVFLFLVMIPINGHTRLNWFWLALLGSASVGVLNNNTSIVGTANQNNQTSIVSQPTILPVLSPTPVNQPTLPFIPLITGGSYIVGINSGLENV